MKKTSEWTVRNRAIGTMLAIVLPLSILSSTVDFILHRNDVMHSIDSQLRVAATMARATLPANYHDRITDAHSVSKEEFDHIVERNNALCQELGMEYLWSLMLVDGQPRFTSASSPDKQVKNGLHAKFYELHSNPELYTNVFQTMEIQTQDNVDPWGNIRAVLVPYRDIHGRKYLFGASKKRGDIHAFPLYIIHRVLITTGFFLVPGILIILTVTKKMTRPISTLAEAAQEIGSGNYSSPVSIHGAREISILSSQLDAMRISIRDKITAQQTTLSELMEFKRNISSSPVIFHKTRLEEGLPIEFISDNVSLLGYPPKDLLSGKVEWNQILLPEDMKRVDKKINDCLEAGMETYNIEVRIKCANGDIRWISAWDRILKNSEGTPTHVQGLLLDVTSQKRTQAHDQQQRENLERTLEELREFKRNIDSSPVIFARVLISPEFPTEFMSENISRLGYSAEQFMNGSISWRQVMPKEDFDRISTTITQTLEAGEDTLRYEGRIIPAKGKPRWFEAWSRILKNSEGGPSYLQSILVDISQRKIAEQRDMAYKQRLKALAQELATVEERERHQLAEIIHDDLSQMVAALNMKFSVLKDAGSQEPINAPLAQEISELIAHIMSTCKSLTWQACPTSLYESDIAAGLKRMADDLENLFGLHAQLHPPGNRIHLAPDAAALLFRCARELLINVAKHSGTLQAKIQIRELDHSVELIVSDQGSGFNPKRLENETPSGFGLFSIRERLAHIDGSMLVESETGKGTRICILVPAAPILGENSPEA